MGGWVERYDGWVADTHSGVGVDWEIADHEDPHDPPVEEFEGEPGTNAGRGPPTQARIVSNPFELEGDNVLSVME
eukprot:g1456.t1